MEHWCCIDTSAWRTGCWCQGWALCLSLPLWSCLSPRLVLAVLLFPELSDGFVQKAAASYRNLFMLRSLLADHLLHHLTITWRCQWTGRARAWVDAGGGEASWWIWTLWKKLDMLLQEVECEVDELWFMNLNVFQFQKCIIIEVLLVATYPSWGTRCSAAIFSRPGTRRWYLRLKTYFKPEGY